MKSGVYRALPIASIALALLVQVAVPLSVEQKAAEHPWFTYLLCLSLVVWLVLLVLQLALPRLATSLVSKGPFVAGVALFFNVVNIFTAKIALFPVLFFPTLDRVLENLVADRAFLAKCTLYSLRLLATGFAIGAVAGFATGVALGYSRRFAYWVRPVTKVLGPIPTTAWLPLALSSFPTTFAASVFLIAFTVWFQLTLMTSSGIQGVNKAYFEVAATLDASSFFQITHVAIPGAAPTIFLGLFYAVCSSFIALMSAEMVGTSAGIGWYVHNQKSVMSYAGVYSGLIVIAVLCSLILTLLFKVRAKILPWEKGVIKW